MTIRICVSILPKTTTEALRLIERAEDARADLIEVRLDCLEDHGELADLAAHGKVPKIATNRKPLKNEAEKRVLFAAAKNGFEYVDVDLANPELTHLVRELNTLGAKPIVSLHESNRSLSLAELNSVLEQEIGSGADVCKIVTTAKRVEDNLTILNFTSAACSKAKIVSFAVGELGKVSRLLSPLFGGYFTFASLERGSETAAGQMTIQEMKAAYELLGLR